MNEKKHQESIHITGSGKINGGSYDVVKIIGKGQVTGDIEANTIRTAGTANFLGSVKALSIHTAGSCRVGKDVSADDFKTAGSCTVEGDIRATRFVCSGSQRVGGDLIAGSIRISGSCGVSNDVEADLFFSKGRFDIGGLLTADEIKIELSRTGTSRANEIGGERIEVRSRGDFWEWRHEDLEKKTGKVGYKLEKGMAKLRDRFGIEIGDIDKLVEEVIKFGEKIKANIEIDLDGFKPSGMLKVQTVEGDEIYLENTEAKVVRGTRITIGKGCQIDHVEYSDSLEVDEKASVGEREKV